MNNYYCIVNKFLNGEWIFNKIENNSEFYNFYLNTKNNELDSINYDYIINILKESELTNIYLNILKEYNSSLISQSDVHGLSHIIRTSIFLLIISTLEKTSINDFKILLESILYHDIGRINDIDDEFHGFYATKKINFLKEMYNEDDYKLICSLITGHCIDDDLHKKVAEYYHIENIDKYYKLLSIVKDADALDRVREYPYIDIKYLRTKSSKRLILFACEFYYNYEMNN